MAKCTKILIRLSHSEEIMNSIVVPGGTRTHQFYRNTELYHKEKKVIKDTKHDKILECEQYSVTRI